MKPTIEIQDNKDGFLLGEALCLAIRDLTEIRSRASAWGCSRTEMDDRIVRLEKMLRSLKYDD